MLIRDQLIELYVEACEAELQAFKPGNVSVYSEGHGMTVADFRQSAKASAIPLTDPNYSLGEKIFYAIEATQQAVGCNTNLGIILLSAPLICAAEQVSITSLRQSLAKVLAETTVSDAEWVFRAICLAKPAGLGQAPQQDVYQPATMNLTEVMRLASERDRIALQYVTEFKDIFDFTLLRYNKSFDCFLDRNWATVSVYSALLNRYPDSHVQRKYADHYNDWIRLQMSAVEKSLRQGRSALDQLPLLLSQIDQAFKSKSLNPGTTADLTVATLLVVFLQQSLNRCFEV